MATERQVVSVSLSQKQSEFIKNRPEGQSAYLQNLIDEQMNRSVLDQTGIPLLPDVLETFLLEHLNPKTVTRDEVSENQFKMSTSLDGFPPERSLVIWQKNENGIASWLHCRLFGSKQRLFKLNIDLISQLRPHNNYCDISTKSDRRAYFVLPDSKLVKAFIETGERLYPELNDNNKTFNVNAIDNMGDIIRSSRFNVTFNSPSEKSPWTAFHDVLSLYVNKVEFGDTDITVTFIDTENIAMYRYPKTIGGLVSLDVNTFDRSVGNPVDTMRYNCWVNPGVQSIRSVLGYVDDGHVHGNTTSVKFHVLESGLADELAQVTKDEFDAAIRYTTLDGVRMAYEYHRRNTDKVTMTASPLDDEPGKSVSHYHVFTEQDKKRIIDTIDNADMSKSFVGYDRIGPEIFTANFNISDKEYLYIDVAKINDPPYGCPSVIVKTSWSKTLSENDVIKHQTWWNGDDIGWLTDKMLSIATEFEKTTKTAWFFTCLNELDDMGTEPDENVWKPILNTLAEAYLEAAIATDPTAHGHVLEMENGNKYLTAKGSGDAVYLKANSDEYPTTFGIDLVPHDPKDGKSMSSVRIRSYGPNGPMLHRTYVCDKEYADFLENMFKQ